MVDIINISTSRRQEPNREAVSEACVPLAHLSAHHRRVNLWQRSRSAKLRGRACLEVLERPVLSLSKETRMQGLSRHSLNDGGFATP